MYAPVKDKSMENALRVQVFIAPVHFIFLVSSTNKQQLGWSAKQLI